MSVQTDHELPADAARETDAAVTGRQTPGGFFPSKQVMAHFNR